MIVQHFQNDHGPFVRHAADQVVHQRLDARIAVIRRRAPGNIAVTADRGFIEWQIGHHSLSFG